MAKQLEEIKIMEQKEAQRQAEEEHKKNELIKE